MFLLPQLLVYGSWIASLAISVPLLLLGMECWLGGMRRGRRESKRLDDTTRPAVDIVVPAHNEQTGIAKSLESTLAATIGGDRIFVVADNCSDDTAKIVRSIIEANAQRAFGPKAEIGELILLERTNQELRGKDYALRYGFDAAANRVKSENDSSDRVTVIVDADCQVSRTAIGHLAMQVAKTGRPAQASYLMVQPDSLAMTAPRAISEFAFAVKNYVRPLGLSKLGGTCTLFGSGMAFPSKSLEKLSGPGGHLVEDMRWTYDMILAGSPVEFCPDAKVTATFPTTVSAADTQRRRWEHGHLQLVCSQLPRLFRGWLVRPRWSTILAALDLVILPLSLLLASALVVGVFLGLSLILRGSLGTPWMSPLLVWIVSMMVAGSGLSVAWMRYRPAKATMGMMLAIPLYAVRKIPLYAAFLFRPERAWIRTDRS